jgi:hypothetical protein
LGILAVFPDDLRAIAIKDGFYFSSILERSLERWDQRQGDVHGFAFALSAKG